MESILDAINEWIKEPIGAINGNLSTMFGTTKVGTIAAEVKGTSQGGTRTFST